MGQWVDVVRVLAALTAVFGVLWFLIKVKGRGMPGAGGTGPTIIDRRGITNGVTLVTVKESGERIVMVVSEQHTEVVSRSPWVEPDPAEATAKPSYEPLPGQKVFAAMLEKATGKKPTK